MYVTRLRDNKVLARLNDEQIAVYLSTLPRGCYTLDDNNGIIIEWIKILDGKVTRRVA
jgi:hypothetical protein